MSLSVVNIVEHFTMFGHVQLHRDSTVYLAVKSDSKREQKLLV